MRKLFVLTSLGALASLVLLGGQIWIIALWRAPVPNQLWQFQETRVRLVAISSSRVYLSSNKIYALDLMTGTVLWTTPEVETGCYISDLFPGSGSVIAVLSLLGSRAEIRSFHPDTGMLLWNKSGFQDKIDSGIHPFAGEKHVYAGDDQNNLVALDRKTGEIKKTVPLGKWVFLRPLISEEVVFYVTPDGSLMAMSDATGEVLWGTPVGCSSTVGNERPVCYAYARDSRLFLWDTGMIRAFDVKTGQFLWQVPKVLGNDFFLLYQGGILYIAFSLSPSPEYRIVAIDGQTGDTIFRKNYEGSYNGESSKPLGIVDGTLIVSGSSFIHGLDPRTGAVLWQQAESTSDTRGTALHSRFGYFTSKRYGEFSTSNELKKVDLKNGWVVWNRRNTLKEQLSHTKPYDSLYLADDVLIIVGTDGLVTAIKAG